MPQLFALGKKDARRILIMSRWLTPICEEIEKLNLVNPRRSKKKKKSSAVVEN